MHDLLIFWVTSRYVRLVRKVSCEFDKKIRNNHSSDFGTVFIKMVHT